MPASLTLSHVTWAAPDCPPLLADLSLHFGPQRTGLVGRNGVGKTTLLRLVAGELAPQTGQIIVSGELGVLRQIVAVDPRETIADLFGIATALATLTRIEQGQASDADLAAADWSLETRFHAALARVSLAVAPTTLLTTLSGGERTRAALAAMLFREPDFLLLDEPTNHLDRAGRQAVLELLGKWRGGALVVSHDRELLETMDAIVELTSLGATRYGGNWSVYRELKQQAIAARERELADAEKRLSSVAREAQATKERQARRSGAGQREAAQGGTPRILLGNRKDRAEKTTGEQARLAERLSEQARAAADAARQRLEVVPPLTVELPRTHLPSGKLVLEIAAVTAGYEPARPILRNLTFRIAGPERAAIVGPNGSGKTTLLSLLTGELQPWQGRVRVLTSLAMLDQRVSLLNPTQSIRENFLRLNPQASENACRAALARFMFRSDAALQHVATLSGGQRLRAGLACVLGGPTPPPLLILDEPTNHLDLDSIAAVEQGLQAYDGALLVVSHDKNFLQALRIDRRVELPPLASS